ncbi:MAG: holo-ACP synthase [Betaproteobacteria bacterium]
MILGIGADMVEIPRVTRMIERYGERLAQRILGASEWAGYRASAHRDRYLASRFAAKEAFGKAYGTGLRAPVLLTYISVNHDALGRPLLELAPPLQALSDSRGIRVHHITLTHERSLACAVVVLES